MPNEDIQVLTLNYTIGFAALTRFSFVKTPSSVVIFLYSFPSSMQLVKNKRSPKFKRTGTVGGSHPPYNSKHTSAIGQQI